VKKNMDTETKNKHKDVAMTDGQSSLLFKMKDEIDTWDNEKADYEPAPALYMKEETTLPNSAVVRLEAIFDSVGKDGQTAYTCKLIESNILQGSLKNEQGEYIKVDVKAGDLVTIWGTHIVDKTLNNESAIGKVFLLRFKGKIKSRSGRDYWDVLVKDVTEDAFVVEQMKAFK